MNLSYGSEDTIQLKNGGEWGELMPKKFLTIFRSQLSGDTIDSVILRLLCVIWDKADGQIWDSLVLLSSLFLRASILMEERRNKGNTDKAK